MSDLDVKLRGSWTGFSQMLNAARIEAKKFGDEIGKEIGGSWASVGSSAVGFGAAMLSVEGLKEFFSGIFESGRQLREMSEQLELDTDSIQRWSQAADKAGVSSEAFVRSLETLRQARQDAREDPTKRAPFANLNLSNEAIGYELTDEQLLRRVLEANGSRVDVRALLGRTGPRLKAALPFLDSETPAFDEETLDSIHKTDTFMKGLKNFFVRLFFGHGERSPEEALQALKYGPGGAAINLGGQLDRILAKPHEKSEAELAREKRKAAEEAARRAEADELELRERQDRMRKNIKAASESEKQTIEAEERLRQARRQAMPSGQRREDIKAELAETEEWIEHYQEMAKTGLSDAGKAKARLNAMEYEVRRQTLLNELREKPISIAGDSLAKAGLYTAAGIAGSPGLGIQQQQLQALKAIERNTYRQLQEGP